MENKNEWRKVKLGDIGEIITGKTPSTKKSDDLGNDYLFLTPKDMTGEKNKYKTERNVSIKIAQKNNQLILKKNSICISCIGSDMGKVCIVKKISLTNQQINSITNVKEDFNYEFIYYKLSMMKEYFKTIAGGTTIPILNKNDFSKIKILIPEIGIQKKITKILSDIDNKIELNNKINDNLEKLIFLIYQNIFSNSIIKKECKMNEYFDISIGKTPPRKNQEYFSNNSNNNLWISILDMKSSGIYINKSSEYLTDEAIKKCNIKIIPKNTLLLSFKLTIGRIAITYLDKTTTNEAIAHFSYRQKRRYRIFILLFKKI